MRFLGTLVMFVGYTLIYAAVANRGKFATEPWLGLMGDAYLPSAPGPSSASGDTTPSVSPGATTPPASHVTRGRITLPQSMSQWEQFLRHPF